MNDINQGYSKEEPRNIINKLKKIARAFYKKLSPRLQRLAYPAIFFYRFCRLFPQLRLKLWVLIGNERTSNMPVSILYAAHDSAVLRSINQNYMVSLILDGSFQERYIGQAWLWKVLKVALNAELNCTLIIVQVSEFHRRLLRTNKWFYIPSWVNGSVGIPDDPSITKDSSLKSDFRRIRKNSLQFEVTKDLKLFDNFYHNMYLPHIKKAYNNSAIVLSYKHMRTEFKNCELLLVTKQEKHIAGILIAYDDVPRLWSLGIRDSKPEYIKDGAIAALFYYSLLYLKDKGFTILNFGTSRAFLQDGVLRYKSKWCQSICGTTSYGYGLKVLDYNIPAKAFLQENPFIFKNQNGLQGAVFVDADKTLSLKELQKIEKKNYYNGLSKLHIYYFNDIGAIKQYSVPPELSERIVLRSAGDIV